MSRNGRRYLVTGACGFVGRKICASLLNDGASLVRLFDIVTRPFSQWRDAELASQFIEAEKSNKVELFQGDLRDPKRVNEACKGIDVVYHVASFGMSGKEMLQKKKIYEVNVQGVQHLLDACIDNDVEMIIYTSTYNVVFAGQKLSNEVNPPYAPLSMHVDEYSRTKTIAERMILSNDGIDTKGKKKLRIVALRPAAIYGPGEERHLPRIIKTAEQGLFRFTIGDPKDMVEWVYVDNLVHAHLIAEKKLEQDAPGVAGNGFFISDQAPINNWEFLGKFVSGLGFTPPTLNIPLWFMFYLGLVIESAHALISPLYNFEPFLTRAEVYKVGVEHYFDSDRAKNVLGYKPIVDSTEGLNRTIDYFKKETKIQNGQNIMMIFIVGLVILLFMLYLFIFKEASYFVRY